MNKKKRKPYIKWYIMSGGLGVVAFILLLVVIAMTMSGLEEKSDDYYVTMPGSETIEIKEAGKFLIYYQYASDLSDGESTIIKEIPISISDHKTGEVFVIKDLAYTNSYGSVGANWEADDYIDIEGPTTIKVVSAYESGDGPEFKINLTMNTDNIKTTLIGFAIALSLFALLAFIGFIMLIIAIVKQISFASKGRKISP